MAERTQKQRPAPQRTEEVVEDAPAPDQAGREAQGRARRPARRDRRGPRGERRGVREELRPKGRPVARSRFVTCRMARVTPDGPRRLAGRLPTDRSPDGAPVACAAPMSMPLFPPGDDPGPSLPDLLKRVGLDPFPRAEGHGQARRAPRHHVRRGALRRRRGDGGRPAGHGGQPHQPPHDGEGAAGRPLQRRGHRRRGRSGHGDGEALPAPARALREGRGRHAQPRGQGQPALDDGPRATCRRPCRAWWWCRSSPATTPAGSGRLFDYDVTGGRYEERDHVATGSGSLHAGTVIKVGYRRGPQPRRGRRPVRAGAVGGGRQRLRHRRTRPAAGHLPGGGHHHRPRASSGSPTTSSPSASPASRRNARSARSASHEHAVLRRPRAGDEGPGRLRPQGHRPGPQPGGAHLRRRHRHRGREPEQHAAQDQRDLRPHRLRRRRASTTSSTSCAWPACGPPTSRATSTAATTSTPAAWPTSTRQILGQIFTHEMKPLEVEILVAEVGRCRPATTRCSTSSTTAPSIDEHRISVLGGDADTVDDAGRGGLPRGHGPGRGRQARGVGAAGPERTLAADDLEAAVLARSNGRRPFRRLDEDELPPPERSCVAGSAALRRLLVASLHNACCPEPGGALRRRPLAGAFGSRSSPRSTGDSQIGARGRSGGGGSGWSAQRTVPPAPSCTQASELMATRAMPNAASATMASTMSHSASGARPAWASASPVQVRRRRRRWSSAGVRTSSAVARSGSAT